MLALFARLLPREFRERVFEPALGDLRLEQRGRLAMALFVLECLRIGLPQQIWHRGRPTRLGVAVFVVSFVFAAGYALLRRAYS
jgi:hypothetical protein